MSEHAMEIEDTTDPPDTTPGAQPPRDKAWLEALMARHGGTLAGFFAARTGDRGLAEELVIETFFRAWRSRDSLRGENVAGWLWTIGRRVLARHYRDRARRPELQIVETLPEQPDGEERIDARTLKRRALRACLGQLSERVQRSAELVWLLGHSYVEAGEITGDAPDTIRMRLKRARKPLQLCLARKGVLR